MFIFREHKHSEYVVLAGKLAVKHAKGDKDELLLVCNFSLICLILLFLNN
jgi:hypothetical protein